MQMQTFWAWVRWANGTSSHVPIFANSQLEAIHIARAQFCSNGSYLISVACQDPT